MSLNPINIFLRFHWLMFTGMIRFPGYDLLKPQFPGSKNTNDSGYVPFMAVTCSHPGTESRAGLCVTFRVTGPVWFHRYLLPYVGIPLFAGVPGFHAKVFFYRASDSSYRGQYLWESREAVERYINSYPGKFMRRVAVPGSLEISILEKGQSTERQEQP